MICGGSGVRDCTRTKEAAGSSPGQFNLLFFIQAAPSSLFFISLFLIYFGRKRLRKGSESHHKSNYNELIFYISYYIWLNFRLYSAAPLRKRLGKSSEQQNRETVFFARNAILMLFPDSIPTSNLDRKRLGKQSEFLRSNDQKFCREGIYIECGVI